MPNTVYLIQETERVFKPSAGAGESAFTLTGLVSGAGRVSIQWDRGSSARPGWFTCKIKTKVGSTPTVGRRLELYLVGGNGTSVTDGNLGVADAAVSAGDKRLNLRWLMDLKIDKADSAEIFTATRRVFIPDRYVSLFAWNDLGVALSATGTDHEVVLTPISDQIQ